MRIRFPLRPPISRIATQKRWLCSAPTMTSGPPRVALFDLDGTCIDSDDLHFHAYRSVLHRVLPDLSGTGAPITRKFYDAQMSGKQNRAIMAQLAPTLCEPDRNAVWQEKERLYAQSIDQGVEPIRGLVAFLDRLDNARVDTAIVTNAPRKMAYHTLGALRLADRFKERIVIGEECEKPKPHPHPYLDGLAMFGVPHSAAVAFEDSPSGIAAARAANIFTIGITSSRTEKELLDAGANIAVDHYEDAALWATMCKQLEIVE